MDYNSKLKGAYKTLGDKVVVTINADFVIDFLFAAGVLSDADYHELTYTDDRRLKTRRLMALLHNSQHPEAFVKLHEAIKKETAYQWLVKQIDDLCKPPNTLAKGIKKKLNKTNGT